MHAYLIMAHHHFYQLKILVSLLDDKRNDLFIHIDEKAENKNLAKELCEATVRKSRIIWVSGIHVTWGGYSQIKCKLYLLKEARKIRKYRYYHLLSGDDLPLRNQDEIHAFFDVYSGQNFVNVGSEKYSKDAEERCRYYYFFQDVIGKSKWYEHIFLKVVRRLCVSLQKIICIDRIHESFKNGWKLCHGSNWFSITDEFAGYVLENKDWIYKAFHAGCCVDELFLQTLVMNSSWKDTLHINTYNNGCKGNLRFIYFENHLPHIWISEDYEKLMESECLFARKFDESIDMKIIMRIKNVLTNVHFRGDEIENKNNS